MSKASDIDLRELIDDAAFDQAAEVIGSDLKDEGSSRWKRALASMGGSRIREAVVAKFNQFDVVETFARGWAKSPDLQKAAEQASKEAETRFLHLGKFAQSVDLLPIITISAAGIESPPIKLVLKLDGVFDAVEIGVRNKHIVELGGGAMKLSAGLHFGPATFLATKPPVEYKLPAKRRFDDPGIRIAPGG